MRPMDIIDRIHSARAEEAKKKYVKQLHKREEIAKIKKETEEIEIREKKIRVLKEFLNLEFIKKLNLIDQDNNQRLTLDSLKKLNVI